MEALAEQRLYRAPALADIERSFELALTRAARGRVFVDLWDLQQFSRCSHCLDDRRRRLQIMNLEQRDHPHVMCLHCGHGLEA
jgi:hypothetical protein